MSIDYSERAFVAANRPVLSLKTVTAETAFIEPEALTEFLFYEDNTMKEGIDPELGGYNGLAVTLTFDDLGSNPDTPSIGFDKFAQVIGAGPDDVNYVFSTVPAYLVPMKKVKDHTYQKTLFFVCRPVNPEDDEDFEKFEAQFKGRELTLLLNIVGQNPFVKESFEATGTVVFDGNEHDASVFTKDGCRYSAVEG